MPRTFVVFRSSLLKPNPDVLYAECSTLITQTRYKKYSKQEDAPQQTDCLTAVSYLYRKTIDLHLTLDWIGNMPRTLVETWKWSAEVILRENLQAGDLIFLGSRKQMHLITHLAIALSVNEVFHSSWQARGGRIEKLEDIFDRYGQLDDARYYLTYVDHRTIPREIKEITTAGSVD